MTYSLASLVDPPSLMGVGLMPMIVDVITVFPEVVVITTVTSGGALVTVAPALFVVVISIVDENVVLR